MRVSERCPTHCAQCKYPIFEYHHCCPMCSRPVAEIAPAPITATVSSAPPKALTRFDFWLAHLKRSLRGYGSASAES